MNEKAMRKGGVAEGGRNLPPPFHGPQQLETIYYHHGYPIESAYHQQPHQTTPKGKKSLAEKLSKTILDRLNNSPSKQNHPGVVVGGGGGGIGSNSPGNSANQAASNWIYPPAFYHPRLIPYQHHGSFIHPAAPPSTASGSWESRYYGDFVEYAYEYPLSSKPPAVSNNAYCGCYDNLHGTVSRASRRTSGKCKHCLKSRQPLLPPSISQNQTQGTVNTESALKKLTTQVSSAVDQTSSPSSLKKSKSALFRDYLEFNGINRLSKQKVVGVNGHVEDEWQSYWDENNTTTENRDVIVDEEVTDFCQDADAQALCSHLRVSEEKSLAKEDITVQVRSGSGTETSPGGIRGGGGLAGHHQAIQPHPFQAKKNFTTFAALNKKVVEPSTPDTSRSSSSSLILQPATTVVAFEEQNKQIVEDLNLGNKPIKVVDGESVDEIESSVDISSSSKKEQEHVEKDQETKSTSPKIFVAVDDDPVTNELKEFVKQRYARRYRSKFSNPRHHRHNKSSNNLIDEVILEEDEDALAAENLEVISEEPSNPVKSILKRNSICTSSSSNSATDSDSNSDENYSNSSSCSESGIELSNKAEDSASTSEEAENSSTADLDNNNKMMMLKRHQQKRKKGVTFSTPEPVKTTSAQPLSTKANNNATTAESSEDELNGYDKVVVSQNLAEEILDEIYGKIEAFNPVTTTTATQVYENSVVNENGAIDAPFHLHDPNINQPKSLADEILDELYGRKSASNGSGPSSPRAALGHQKSGISKKKVELAVVDHPYEEIQSRTKISADLEHSPAITELAKRFKKQPSSKKVSTKSLRSKINTRTGLSESSSMSNLFNDTTRLRLLNRPSLSNMFSSNEAPPICRPKDPPPPPPPVEQKLLPVTPPRKCFPMFTNDELDRINSVINCQRMGDQDSHRHCDSHKIISSHSHEDILEENETIDDEFSTDEFSEDEFEQATYENILSTSETKSSTDLEDDDDSGNVYDSVPEMIEEDSLEEKMSFGAEYDTSEAGNSPPPPLPITPPPYMLLPENKDKIQILKSASSSSSNSQFSRNNNNNNHNNLTSAQNNSTTTQPSSILSAEDFHSHYPPSSMLSMKGGIIPELIEKATEKTVIFTSSSQINKINEEHQEQQQQSEILISSSSWIDLQSLQNNNNEAINVSNVASSTSTEHRHCTEQEEHHKLDESLCVLSSSNLDIKDDVIRIIKAESEVNKDSLEPVKPPRLKKLARIQQQQKQELQQKNNKELQEIIEETNGGQQHLKWQASKDSLEQHLKDRMKKISHMDQNRLLQQSPQQHSSLRPDISYPVLMTTTLNPNDADGHRSLSTFNPNSMQSHWDHLNTSKMSNTSLSSSSPNNGTGTATNKTSSNNTAIASTSAAVASGTTPDKITFKDLKRYASNSFASLSSGITQNGWRSLNFIANGSSGNGGSRSTFYEADTCQEAIYEDASKLQRQTSPTYSDHIYEEIPECKQTADQQQPEQQRPLPPIPEAQTKSDNDNSSSSSNNKVQNIPKNSASAASTSSSSTTTTSARKTPVRNGSFFEGASKYEILHYLKDAKDRMGHGDFEIDLDETSSSTYSETYPHGFVGRRNLNHRISSISHVSDSSVDSDEGILRHKLNSSVIDIERTDSGVGSETSKSSKASVEIRRAPSLSKSSDSGSGSGHDLPDVCPDCEQDLREFEEIICKRCAKRRSERKEIITEIAETEAKYGRDLRIVIEEFYRPMLVAGLLTSDQLAAIFLNADELIQVNARFCEVLRDAVEMAYDSGDEDLARVHVGKLFLDSLSMLRAFESYCTRQASASLLLTTLEKEKELLRIFLKVSQMENSMLRRMNLSSFLMVPVQRVTKYPLLLSRLHKVTPSHHEDKNNIKLAQDKIEAALEQMNKDAKDVVNSSKLWRRLQPMMSSSGNNSPSKKSESGHEDLSSIQLRKMALEVLGWNQDETRFPVEGRVLFTQPNDANWKIMVRTVKMNPIQAILCVMCSEELPEVTTNKELIFPPDTATIREACLIMVREKSGKYTLVRDPLPLEQCVICCEQDWDDCFEIQEFINKETFVFKGEEPEDTMMWFKSLQFYTQCLGGWRKRRKGLANIMIDPNIVSPSTAAAAAGISGISVSGDDPDEDNVPEGAAAVE